MAPLTITLPCGQVVLAREDKHGIHPVTYANRTQAARKVWALGPTEWHQWGRRAIYIARIPNPSKG